ncbi:calcium-activated potassium channel subunit beta-2-like [Boleophthalmus pectinirostris]|uniref:calcium-activated potassium channel subunit beta-2-like n=1 Tax=Boleophthalmus pectinirostris TaxID=150288 RepID=UPI0024327095|nr:calcium-activated potassium channel subunit beta-2-like [Boleophthalmus pectinirostris]
MLQQRAFTGTWWVNSASNTPVPKASSENMYLWSGGRSDGKTPSDSKSLYQRLKEYELLDKKKTVTALRAGEDRAILLGLSMMLFSVMTYFVMGITILRSYSDSIWTEEANCTVLNSTLLWDVNCSYSCGAECWKSSRYPCLQVYVSLHNNSSRRVLRLLHNEDTHEDNPECFYIPKCHKDYAATRELVQDISERLRNLQSVPCFIDPKERTDMAILTQIYSRGAVFHSLFWPTCSLIGGSVLIAMVKLTQYLSILCEGLSKIKT